MHILIIPSLLYQTRYQPLTGIFQKHQANCLNAAGHRVGVLSAGLLPFKSVLAANLYKKPVVVTEDGVTVVRRYNKAFLPQRYLRPWQQSKAMCTLGLEAYEKYAAINGKPDIVHAHDCLYGGVLARKLKEKFGLPYVITEHSTLHLRGLIDETQMQIIRDVLQAAGAVTTVGSGLLKVFTKNFGDLESVKNAALVYNLLDESFEDIPENMLKPKNTGDNGKFIFLNVANLVEQKAQMNLLRALPKVLASYQNVELRIGGAGPMQPVLAQAIAELGLGSHVNLLGLLDRARVKNEMAACDAFVLPSRVETFGVVLIEAMAMGKPVIATVCGGPEDFVDDNCGYLVPNSNVDALAGAMVKMIENRDAFDAEKIRNHCIDRFGKAAFGHRLESIYKEALTNNQA